MAKDPRTILGVGPNATDEDITRAYREMAKRYHPDLNPDDEWAAQRMRELNTAYEQLKQESEAIKAEESIPPIERAKRLLEIHEYETAAELLGRCPPPRNAEWFCLSAVAAYGMGDSKTALGFAKRAVALKPDVAEYQKILRDVKTGEKASRRRLRSSTTPVISCGTLFFLLILAALALMFFFSPLFSSLRWWQQ